MTEIPEWKVVEPTHLDRCLDKLIETIAHLANYCRERVADHPCPHRLNAEILNLIHRVEVLESLPCGGLAGQPARDDWQILMDRIAADCHNQGWTPDDAGLAWTIGHVSLEHARSLDARRKENCHD